MLNGIDYLSEFHVIDNILPKGKVLVDKGRCGCGGTEYYLTNEQPIVVIGPRLSFINCHYAKLPWSINICYSRNSRYLNTVLKSCIHHIYLLIVLPLRFERRTYCLEGSCSIQLSYGS